MNYSTAVFLVNNHVRAVRCAYELDKDGKPTGNFEVFKTFDTAIKVSDLVVVPTGTRVKMTVVKVVETDVEVDLESTTPMEWIVGRIDSDEYQATLAKETTAINTIKAAEVRKKREEPLLLTSEVSEDGEENYWLEQTLPSLASGPEAAYVRERMLEAISSAIAELPEKQREVFIAHELDGRSFKDMAAESGANLNTLLGQKRQAVLYLRARLQPIYDELT